MTQAQEIIAYLQVFLWSLEGGVEHDEEDRTRPDIATKLNANMVSTKGMYQRGDRHN